MQNKNSRFTVTMCFRNLFPLRNGYIRSYMTTFNLKNIKNTPRLMSGIIQPRLDRIINVKKKKNKYLLKSSRNIPMRRQPKDDRTRNLQQKTSLTITPMLRQVDCLETSFKYSNSKVFQTSLKYTMLQTLYTSWTTSFNTKCLKYPEARSTC